MLLSIVTPSFQSSPWLKLCIASVADQGVEVEHIVQDAGSNDGTLDWLPFDQRVRAFVEKDSGMYDAVNRGLKKSSGEICAYLNCDEQYLPGALRAVKKFFQENPSVEMVFGDCVIVNSSGEFLCHRKSLVPLRLHSLVSHNLSILSCATFFRRSLFEKRGLFFNPQLRDLGDADWLVRCISQKVPMASLKTFTSAFTNTGENMSAKPNAQRERKNFVAAAPRWARAMRPLVIAHHRLRKLAAGGYSGKPFQYQIYIRTQLEKRTVFDVKNPSGRWNSD